VSGLLTMVESR